MAARQMPWISPEAYMDREESAHGRHTYYAGLIIAMADGTFAHAVLAMNLGGELRTALRGRGCRVAGSDVLFRAGSGDLFTYPDIAVVCGPLATMEGRPNVITNPVFAAEILSPGTEAFDRGAKSHEYRGSPSLRKYALISQERPLIELHTRNAAGVWIITEAAGLESDCEFTAIGCRIPMAAIYEGVLPR